ncbi:MAG TPA: response regulator transcription factor [Bacteroidota bacterium]
MSMLKVLVVDPDAASRSRSVTFLQKDNGVRIVGQAQDGLEVFLLTELLNPDLIVAEISMPGMNGFELATRMKRQSPLMRFVFLTRHDEESYRVLAEMLPADGFVRKSVMETEFPDVLRSIRKHMPHNAVRYGFNAGNGNDSKAGHRHRRVATGHSLGGVR